MDCTHTHTEIFSFFLNIWYAFRLLVQLKPVLCSLCGAQLFKDRSGWSFSILTLWPRLTASSKPCYTKDTLARRKRHFEARWHKKQKVQTQEKREKGLLHTDVSSDTLDKRAQLGATGALTKTSLVEAGIHRRWQRQKLPAAASINRASVWRLGGPHKTQSRKLESSLWRNQCITDKKPPVSPQNFPPFRHY